MSEAQFRKRLQDNGYSEPYAVEFKPNSNGEMHHHDFSAMIMVTRGALTLDYESGPVTYGAGDWCEVPAGTRHAERAGSNGASALAGKKSG